MKRWVALYLVSLAAAALAANRFVRIPENQAIAWPNHDLIDVNHATAKDWMLLPGIGEKRAQALVALQKQKGCLKGPEELTEAEEISKALAEQIKPYLTFE